MAQQPTLPIAASRTRAIFFMVRRLFVTAVRILLVDLFTSYIGRALLANYINEPRAVAQPGKNIGGAK